MFNSFPQPKPDSGGSDIKSIQSGTATIGSSIVNVTVAISPVDLSKAILTFTYQVSNSSQNNIVLTLGKFNSATQLLFERNTLGGQIITISWQVIEYYNVKSLQSGQATISSGTTSTYVPVTVPVTSINTSKAILVASVKSTDTTAPSAFSFIRYEITNATNITLYAYWITGVTITFQWQLIEFN